MNRLDFYQRMGVQPPHFPEAERARRRLAWRNERVLYKRRCDKTAAAIISVHSEDKPYPVWSNAAWWADDWDARDFGREIDFNRPFFEQFVELYAVVPQQAAQHSKSENCDYTNQSQCNKDCYLVVASNYSRDCLYGMWFQHCDDCVDCQMLEQSQLCYEVLNGTNCFESTYSENIDNCSNVHFCKNCIGCKNCLGCVNLRNKEYCYFNRQLSKADFTVTLAEARLDSRSGIAELSRRFSAELIKHPHKYYVGRLTEDSSGDYLQEVRDAENCYNCRHAEKIADCRDAWNARNCSDLVETLDNDFCIELEGCWANVDCGFSMKLNQTNDVWYSSHCFSSHDLFGCVGMRHAEYCILNKQHTADDYRSLRSKLVDSMKHRGEWGEFFPATSSFFGYNETVAHEYFPLSMAQALQEGFRWKSTPEPPLAATLREIPDSIYEVHDDILSATLLCKQTAKPYRITSAELEFCRKLSLPLPEYCYEVRHQRRMARRNPRQLHARQCAACATNLQTTFAPERPEHVLCESCYLKQI